MAGGTWTGQNKVQPGVYINTKSKGNLAAQIGEKGTVAIAEALSWGPGGKMQTIIPGEELMPYIGYDAMHEKALFLQEMMKGSDTTPGPIKILLYRLKGTGGAKAAATVGTVTATALYEGVRGNDITVVIQEEPDMEGTYTVSTVVDGKVRDEQVVSKASELSANNWVTFSSSAEDITETAGTALTGGKDPTITNADHAEFLSKLEKYDFDIVVYDGTEQNIVQAYASFVKRISEKVGHKCQAVMAGAESCDSEWVISCGNGVKLSDGTVLSPQQATWWLGGAEAGASYNQSLTYSRYLGAVSAAPKLSDAEIETAIKAGKIVFIDSFDTVKICTDINTFTSITVDKQKYFSKNRVMRVLNQFCNDVYKQFSLYYIGKINNNEDGRNLLKGWIVGYLNEMQANGGIQNFEADDIQVSAGTDVDAVVVNAAIQPVDSVEKIYMTVTVSADTSAE